MWAKVVLGQLDSHIEKNKIQSIPHTIYQENSKKSWDLSVKNKAIEI